VDAAGELIAVLEPEGNRWIIGRGFASPTLPAPPQVVPPTAESSGPA